MLTFSVGLVFVPSVSIQIFLFASYNLKYTVSWSRSLEEVSPWSVDLSCLKAGGPHLDSDSPLCLCSTYG